MNRSDDILDYFATNGEDAEHVEDIPSIKQASKDLGISRKKISEILGDLEKKNKLVVYTREDSGKKLPIVNERDVLIQDYEEDIIVQSREKLREKRLYLKGMIQREPTVEEVAQNLGIIYSDHFERMFRNAVSETKWVDPSEQQMKDGAEKLQGYVKAVLPTMLSWSNDKLYDEVYSNEIIEWKKEYSEELDYDIKQISQMKDDSQDLAEVFVEVENPIGKFMKEPHFSVIANPVDGYWEHR